MENEPDPSDIMAVTKYDAWKEFKGMSKEDAQKKYAEMINSMLKAAGVKVD